MATHSSVLAWRIPGMGEPGGLLRRPRPRELRAFFSCMAWRAIPGPLSTGLHSRLPRGVRPRLEGKPRTPLSSRVATRLSWSPLSSDGKESACSAGGWSLIPESGRFPREGNDNPLQYSCLAFSHAYKSPWVCCPGPPFLLCPYFPPLTSFLHSRNTASSVSLPTAMQGLFTGCFLCLKL